MTTKSSKTLKKAQDVFTVLAVGVLIVTAIVAALWFIPQARQATWTYKFISVYLVTGAFVFESRRLYPKDFAKNFAFTMSAFACILIATAVWFPQVPSIALWVLGFFEVTIMFLLQRWAAD